MKFRLFFLLLVLSYSGLSLSETYRWVDKDGVVSYSQTLPADQEADAVIINNNLKPSASDSNQPLDRLLQRLEDVREDKELNEQSTKQDTNKEALMQKNCLAAKSNLKKLEGLGNRLLLTTTGDYIRLTEEERQKRMDEARKQIQDNCPH